jgi:pilus assembly protein Flp/PilA
MCGPTLRHLDTEARIGTRLLRKDNIMKAFINMLRDQSGASAAEYALILAIVGTGIAVAAIALGGSISTAMTAAGTCVSSQGKTCP